MVQFSLVAGEPHQRHCFYPRCLHLSCSLLFSPAYRTSTRAYCLLPGIYFGRCYSKWGKEKNLLFFFSLLLRVSPATVLFRPVLCWYSCLYCTTPVLSALRAVFFFYRQLFFQAVLRLYSTSGFPFLFPSIFPHLTVVPAPTCVCLLFIYLVFT